MQMHSDEESVFLHALDIPSPRKRAAFLDRVCGHDETLRARIESLISAYDEGQFLELPAQPLRVKLGLSPLTEAPGARIGPYKLVEQIGEGGMGVVYLASQREPIRRTVALKIIKLGMDTQEVITRFEGERQALGLMDHPNIAQVFDGGVTDSGRPYFAMEFVKGSPVTEYCDREQLSTRERLALFVDLCHGVQHAHQKGVIHRDLKPSNVLIDRHTAQPVPKIIDFGVAKALGRHLTEQSLHTAHDQLVGTPLYMSPEQAGLGNVDVDTRSDVYSLGVMLYELLTGNTPIEHDTPRTVSLDELRRIIREVDPPRPSARVSMLEVSDLSTISLGRRVEPHKLNQELRGELDWIVMKALEKDRERRYATANGLAADVERYLHDEPVEACPPSAWYRFATFTRRNRVALATCALAVMALFAGTGVSVWQAIRASAAEQRAEVRSGQARRAVDEMYTQFAEKWLRQHSELNEVQREFLEKALAFYDQFAAERGNDPQTQFDAASARFRTARIQQALGTFDQAEAFYKESISQFEQLVTEFPDSTDYVGQLGVAYGELASLYSELGNVDRPEQLVKQAVAVLEKSVVSHPEDAELIGHLAVALRLLGHATLRTNGGLAEQSLLRSRDLCQEILAKEYEVSQFRLEYARCDMGLASLYLERKQLPAAEQAIRLAISHFEKLSNEDPASLLYRGLLGSAMQNLAVILAESGRDAEALQAYRRVTEVFEALVKDFPERKTRGPLLTAYFNLIQAVQNPEEVVLVGRKGIDLGEQLVREFPTVPSYQEDLTIFLLATGHLIRASEPDKARSGWERAYAIWEKLVAEFPDEPRYADALARTSAFLAANYATGPADDPLYNPSAALTRIQRAVALMPEDDYYQVVLGRTQYRLDDLAGCIATITKVEARDPEANFDDFYVAMAYWRLGKEVEAREMFARGEESLEKPWDPSWYPDPAAAQVIRGEAAALLGVMPPAVESGQEPTKEEESSK